MRGPPSNRFDVFFTDGRYVALKNHLYNYLLRKKAVGRALRGEAGGPFLEVGCGIAPVTEGAQVVYSDLSAVALSLLRSGGRRGHYVAADAACLPFKSRSFRVAVCSEVLEHLRDDRAALSEMARVVGPSGRLVLTFPHGRFYFTRDDRFVGHFRRYEVSEMTALLHDVGFKVDYVGNVLGPLEKVTMIAATFLFAFLPPFSSEGVTLGRRMAKAAVAPFVWLNRLYAAVLWMEARVVPRGWAAVLVIKATRYE